MLRFWLDTWCGETSLRDQFPKLYRIVSHPDASVQDLLSYDGTRFHWDVNFSSCSPGLGIGICNLVYGFDLFGGI
jgi:hypothetical protein